MSFSSSFKFRVTEIHQEGHQSNAIRKPLRDSSVYFDIISHLGDVDLYLQHNLLVVPLPEDSRRMVSVDQAKASQNSLDAILRGLTERPNVESTLILSRKDGSVIKATGFASTDQRPRASSTIAYSGDAANNVEIKPAGPQDSAVDTDTVSVASPPEQLASSIFDFVKSASSLGLTLCEVSAENDDDSAAFRRTRQETMSISDTNKTSPDETNQARDESQVQLLRLRIKSREIIVFPDPQYLCCVVQRVGKQGAAGDPR